MVGTLARFLLGLAVVLSFTPAKAQYTGSMPVTCRADGSSCVGATPVANPDGTFVGSGGSGTPTGTAGSPNAAVVTVQGITNGTPQNTTPAGNVAAGATDAGNPVKVGGIYSSTLPTLTDGQRGNLQVGSRGSAAIQLMAPDSPNAVAVVTTPNDTGANTSMNALNVYSASRLYDASGTQWVRARGDTAGQWSVGRGGTTLTTGQVSVGTSATLIAAARTGRQKIGVTVTTAVQCAFGNSGVTLTTGWPLAAVAYASDSWDTTAALYGVCASTATVGFREQY